MSTIATLGSELRDLYARESSAIQAALLRYRDGRAAIAQRTALVDSIVLRLWNEIISADTAAPKNLALVATGGYGRGWLFPHSDIDLLFLHARRRREKSSLKIPSAAFRRNFGICA